MAVIGSYPHRYSMGNQQQGFWWFRVIGNSKTKLGKTLREVNLDVPHERLVLEPQFCSITRHTYPHTTLHARVLVLIMKYLPWFGRVVFPFEAYADWLNAVMW